MKKYCTLCLLLVVSILLLTGCGEKPNIAFKNDYESINGKENSHGKIHRTITIPEDNPFVTVKVDEIVKKIENKETFYAYFGSKLCPWCRSTIEKACEIALDHGVSTIYYVDVWDDEGNEIIRDKYVLDDNDKPTLSINGDDNYFKLLTYFDAFLDDYTIKNSDDKEISVGEKRIYAPTYVYIHEGVVKKLTTGISSKQKDPREELTEEILLDEKNAFEEIFSEVCDIGC